MTDNIIKDIWKYRHLIVLFSFNEVKLRYRNSVLGFVWSFLEPLLMLSILYFVFTNIIQTKIENYPLYLLLGLIIWYMFSRATTLGLSSLSDRVGILKTIYIRKEIIVISACLTSFIMMLFEFAALGVFMAVFQFVPPITIVLLPLLLVSLFFLSLGVSFFLSIMNVHFKDIKFIWQVILQAGFFLSPIIYSLETFPENLRQILLLNPMVPLLDTAHQLVLYNSLPTFTTIVFLISLTIGVFFSGFLVFKIKSKYIVENL
ncbi:MAG: ABC transporter permease [Nitrosarchaeum sp.]